MEACAGGLSNDTAFDRYSTALCTPGRGLRGTFCSECIIEDYTFDPIAQWCVPPDSSFILLIVFVVVVFILITGPRLWRSHYCQPKDAHGKLMHARKSLDHFFHQLHRAGRKSIVPLKLCISFYQVCRRCSNRVVLSATRRTHWCQCRPSPCAVPAQANLSRYNDR